MSLKNRLVTGAGVLLLVALWAGPLPDLARESFSVHMVLHMGVVAIAAPLVVIGLVDRAVTGPESLSGNPILASAAELIVVWGWHTPALHVAARTSSTAFVLEQVTFLIAGLWLWAAATGGRHPGRRWAGVAGLLFTSIHMTLLGSLFTVAPRVLYGGHHTGAGALADQHLGGGIMLVVGGLSYLIGGLALAHAGLSGRASGEEQRS